MPKLRSRFLSLVLRHRPEVIGPTLDPNGWVEVDGRWSSGSPLGPWPRGHTAMRIELDDVVASNNKRRFVYSEDGQRIRASQGHSIQVDLDLEAQEPPEVLYNGTARRSLPAIKEKGLLPMDRVHVRLSVLRETAL